MAASRFEKNGIFSMAMSNADYDAYQCSFHEAFKDELYTILDHLPLRSSAKLLDLPCGNGFYSRRLLERLENGCKLVAVDQNTDLLCLASNSLSSPLVEVWKADAYELPFSDSSFDLIWCAQSLISLDPKRAVREMARVVMRRGIVAVLEVDEFYRVLLPWPADLEAALPLAIQQATIAQYGDAKRNSPVRKLRTLLRHVGFSSIRRETRAFDRCAPFDVATSRFLLWHLKYLREFAYPYLSTAMKAKFESAADPDSKESIFRFPDSELVCINVVYLATKEPNMDLIFH
jgi:ubiquinone/menaquinone biosynthesis C-methylase UbiE